MSRMVLCGLWLLLVGPVFLNGCAEEELSVKLDPEYWLLRDDLPAPGTEGRALRAAGKWGLTRWAPDVPPGVAWGAGRRPLGGQPAPVAAGTFVALRLDPAARTLEGRAEIVLVAEETDLDSVRFLLSAAGVDEVRAENPAAAFTYEGNVLTVTPDAPVPVGTGWTVTVAWHDRDVEITTDSFPEWGGDDILVGYLGEPSTFFTFGYWFWPRVAGADTESNIEFAVSYPSDLTLLLSGERRSSRDNGDGTHTDVWALDHPVQWHVSLALAEYEQAAGQCGSTTVEVYGMPIEGEYPIVPQTYVPVLQSVCENYRQRFGEPAFTAVRLAGVDERFTNGYSSPTLLIVPNYTLDDDGSGSFPARDFFLAHEFSHQWWGNDVFMDSMADAWLTEGMADYSAVTYLDTARGHEQARYFWLDEAKLLLDYYQQGGRDHPLVPADSSDLEPVIYYLKGAWVLRMLEGVIGEAAMAAALRSYRTTHPFAVAATQDFVDSAEVAAGQDLDWFFEQWLSGTGVMSLRETHRDRGDDMELTVVQESSWSSDPERFYRMPLAVRLMRGGRTGDHRVTVSGALSTHTLQKP